MQNDLIRNRLNTSAEIKVSISNDELLVSEIMKISNAMVNAFKSGNSVYFCGNGGSAADAQHLAAEFSGRFYIDRKPLPSEALHCNTSFLTAVGNDYGYENVYSRLIEAIGKPGDILVGISTSGNSPNILKAFATARAKEMITVCFTGQGGGRMAGTTDYLIQVPSADTPRIQESHITVGHIICEIVETTLFSK
ncbi:MAG: D-sedoheptulose 7-phosphate isomerase [Ferruginibacter sp.]